MTRAWTLPTLFLLAGLLVATPVLLRGSLVEGGVLLVVFLVLAVVHSPLVFPRSLRAEEARRRSAEDGWPVVYWRPGCKYCIRLRFGLDDGQPRTLDQIGKLFGLSRERVRQIEREVMAKLRHGERADRLRSYAS